MIKKQCVDGYHETRTRRKNTHDNEKEDDRMKKRVVSTLLISALALIGMAGKDMVRAKTVDLEDGLIAHWTFDGNLTEEQNGTDASNGGKQISYVEGVYGKAASFNGKDNYLTVEADGI